MFESCVNMFEHVNYVNVNMVNVKWRYKLASHICSMNKFPRVKKLVSKNKIPRVRKLVSGPVGSMDMVKVKLRVRQIESYIDVPMQS